MQNQPDRKRYRFIGCEIIYREACRLAATVPDRVDLEFLRKGLHNVDTPEMLAAIQERIDAADEGGYDAILLGYARCSDGLVGIQARSTPLVIPRAHDCITLFFGSRQAYQEYFDAHPGTYYLTTGWIERNAPADEEDQPTRSRRGADGQSYEQLVAKYGRDNADYIVQTLGGWRKNYTHILYLQMGVCDESPFIEQARRRARREGWQFLLREGDWTLLEKLFRGRWDDDFVVLAPGERIIARNDERILDGQ